MDVFLHHQKLMSGKFIGTSENGCQNGLQDLENAIISLFNVYGVAVFYVFDLTKSDKFPPFLKMFPQHHHNYILKLLKCSHYLNYLHNELQELENFIISLAFNVFGLVIHENHVFLGCQVKIMENSHHLLNGPSAEGLTVTHTHVIKQPPAHDNIIYKIKVCNDVSKPRKFRLDFLN